MVTEPRFALEIIGCNVLTYGHFAPYEVVDSVGIPYTDVRVKSNLNQFLLNVENFYKSKTLLNSTYGDDLKEQNAVKRFVLSRIKKNSNECYSEGMKWVEEFMNS